VNDPAKKRAGVIGAGMVMAITYCALILGLYVDAMVTPLRGVLIKSFMFSLIFGGLGYAAGGSGARCQNVLRAIVSGILLLAIACGVVFSLYLLLGMNVETARRYWFLAFRWTVVFALSGGLVSGWGSIIARDYRRFQKLRVIPQFTLQEMFIFSFLVMIMVSAISSSFFYRR
jgi:hypothetical protein